MKSLASLSKYLGCYDKWTSIRHNYQLKWSNGDSLEVFNKIFTDKQNYKSMVYWLENSIKLLPTSYAKVLIYCTLTGLRAGEAFKSIKLIQNDKQNYLNEKLMILEHFKYPSVFLRRTKKAYVSIVTKNMLEISSGVDNCSYNSLNMYCKRNNLDMRMSYCRKIYATHLRTSGVEQETIDFLQGRVPRSVFARHYFRPDIKNDKRIIHALNELYNSIKN
jgi:Archaeal phage integrase